MDKALMLKEIREFYKLHRNKDFASFFDISEQLASIWAKTGNFDMDIVYKFCPDISPDWLLSYGEKGEMIRPATQTINGNNNTQVGHDYNGGSKESLEMALAALAEQQRITLKAQSQIDNLLEIMKEVAANK